MVIPDSVIAAHIAKPMTEAPTKMNVARLLSDSVDEVVLMKPRTPISTTIVRVRMAFWIRLIPLVAPKTTVTTASSTVNVIQYDFLVVMLGACDSFFDSLFFGFGRIFAGLGM